MEEVIAKILEAVIICSLPFIFRAKVHPPNEFYQKRLEELQSTFQKIDLLSSISLFFIGIPICTILFGTIFWLLFSVTEPNVPADALFFSPSYGNHARITTSLSMGLILGFASIFHIYLYLLKDKLAQDFDLYIQYTARKSSINFISFTKAWATFWSIIAFVFLSQIDTSKLKIDNNSIELRRFFSINSETYHFEDIQGLFFSSLEKAPNGSLVKNERYRILFKNGKQWIIDDWLSGNVSKDSLATYLSRKTSLNIVHQSVNDW